MIKETGYYLQYLMDQLIVNQYPHYLKYIHEYCRPLGTSDATFNNFNCEQTPSKPHSPERENKIIDHVCDFINACPFLPLHTVL